MAKGKVMVAMSGGVDSSVAAALLLEQGYEVIGVTMQIWQDSGMANRIEGGCCSLSAVDDARRVANKLGIPYYVLNMKDIFADKVINYFIDEYFQGRTPNPCISCNRYVKFDALLRKAVAMGMDKVATGHYARIKYDSGRGRYLLKKSVTEKKDQSYALYNLTQYQLERILTPVGDYTKEEIRKIAENIGISVAHKPDSQEICFVEDNNYGRFISESCPGKVKPGNFVDKDGNVLGRHKGIIYYTIGQRKGLGITFGKPMYVIDIDAEKNEVVLGDETQVFSDSLVANDLNFISIEKLDKEMKVTAKTRYTAKEADATIFPMENGEVKVVFDSPQRAITPGQSVVFYDGDIVVGGGTIVRTPAK
ncbi:MAG TPA: tRNA 2-thiouridine(34) synthase MnmA [Clostridiaceae bacterium]|nr:tRNA 2-thiouridine(34) synthase MnmA [Clostridiaceae bacterium]